MATVPAYVGGDATDPAYVGGLGGFVGGWDPVMPDDVTAGPFTVLRSVSTAFTVARSAAGDFAVARRKDVVLLIQRAVSAIITR